MRPLRRVSPLALLLTLHCGHSAAPAPRTANTQAATAGAGRTSATKATVAADSTLAPCGDQKWLRVPPAMTADSIFGTGVGQSSAEAERDAKTRAAATISTEISSTISDFQSFTERGRAHSESTSISEKTKETVNQRLRECQTRDVCRDTANHVHAAVECSRRSPLERRLIDASRKIAAGAPTDGTILSVPGIELPNTITRLGEYARSTAAEAIAASGGNAQIIPASSWDPKPLKVAAAEHHAKYVLRAQYSSAGQQRYHFSVYFQDPESEAMVGAPASFDTDLEPWQLPLVAATVGPLEPPADGVCIPRVSSALNKTDLAEGDLVELTYSLCEESFVYIYDVWEDGHIVLMYPRAEGGGQALPAGGKHTFPDEALRKAGMGPLTACPLPGRQETKESYKLVISPVPLELPGTKTVVSRANARARGGTDGLLRELDEAVAALRARKVPLTEREIPFVIHSVPGSRSGCPH